MCRAASAPARRASVGRSVAPGEVEGTVAAIVRSAQAEITPISDVRGTETAKRLWVRQLLIAHFARLVSGSFAGWGPLLREGADAASGRSPGGAR